jgi:hypothetical protein
MAICAEGIAGHQSPGHGVYSPAWNLRRCFSAEDGKHLVFQAFDPVLNQYKDRHFDAAA